MTVLVLLGHAVSSAVDSLLIVRGSGTEFAQAVKGLRDELGREVPICELVADSLSYEKFNGRLIASHPAMVVLMDNRSVSFFRRYQSAQTDTTRLMPSVSLMGVSLDRATQGLRNAAAVCYEVPIVTAVVGLRSTLRVPTAKVGVVYRAFLSDFVAQNTVFCGRENIGLVPALIPDDPRAIRRAVEQELSRLYTKEKIDALWIPNDNALLTREMVTEVWVPAINRYKRPVIVGVKVLVQPGLRMGTFAVLPDHEALGTQAGEMVREAHEYGWKFPSRMVAPPVSVYKIVNLSQAEDFCHVKRESLVNVDQILDGQEKY